MLPVFVKRSFLVSLLGHILALHSVPPQTQRSDSLSLGQVLLVHSVVQLKSLPQDSDPMSPLVPPCDAVLGPKAATVPPGHQALLGSLAWRGSAAHGLPDCPMLPMVVKRSFLVPLLCHLLALHSVLPQTQRSDSLSLR